MSTSATVETPLTNRRILRFFYPLALSWLLMGLEGPISASIIGRSPGTQLNLAAFQVYFALALFIESPVIDLLSTATALAKSRQNYMVIRRFVAHLMIWITVAHAAFVFSPAYEFITLTVLHLPKEVSDAAHPALTIMIPWSACIGWRRYLQGIMIRFGQTRYIGYGTGVRLVAMATSAFALSFATTLPSAQVVAAALIMSVFSEASFVHWASRRVIRTELGRDESDEPELSMRSLAKFHFPLTATTMVMFLAQPMVSAALARSPDPISSMAAWQVAFSLMWLARAAIYALPEVVITLGSDPAALATLRRFCVVTGAFSCAVLLILWGSGAANLFFEKVAGVSGDTLAAANLGFILGALLPILGALQSFVRGGLTIQRRTTPRLLAIGFGIPALWACLMVGVSMKAPGVVTAAVSITVGILVELIVLAIAYQMAGPIRWPWSAAKAR